MSYNWDEIKVGIEISILTGLLGLIQDIDESRANELGAKIIKKGCSSIVALRIDSILSFTLDEFSVFQIRGRKIYCSKKLSDVNRIKRKMALWLSSVPRDDLNQIERLYLIPAQHRDYIGTYTPILCSIMVEWNLTTSWFNPVSYFSLLRIEKTLYHEIGHHVHRHSFGQDPEQEKEADEYALKILTKNYPILKRIVRIIKYVLGNKNVKSEK